MNYASDNFWRERLPSPFVSFIKEAIYFPLRPMLDLFMRRHLARDTLREFRPRWTLPERGLPVKSRLRWGSAGKPLGKATVLVQGVGFADEVVLWAQLGARKIIGVDLMPYERFWRQVIPYVRDNYGAEVEFHTSPGHLLSFLDDGCIDICSSSAVLEHVKNLPDFMREVFRILRDDGMMYAAYGPLWYAPGGDHFSGRGGERNYYNHLLLSHEQYERYYRDNPLDTDDEYAAAYHELDLFSHLTTAQYLSIFGESGFVVDELILEVSKTALRIRSGLPGLFAQVKKQHPECMEDDFVIKSNLVRLRKKLSSGASDNG